MSSHQQQINDEAAEAMRRADNAYQEYPVEEPREKSEAEKQRDEAAAEAQRRAEIGDSKGKDEL